jgi:hypothetical protein
LSASTEKRLFNLSKEMPLMPIERDFEVINIGLKGKAKVPTVILESDNGEKFPLKLVERSHLESFKIGQRFTMNLGVGAQRTLLFPVGPPAITDATATIPEGVCPKGVLPKDSGSSELCDKCGHQQELSVGGVASMSCDLNPKPASEENEENST